VSRMPNDPNLQNCYAGSESSLYLGFKPRTEYVKAENKMIQWDFRMPFSYCL
jgi:hypothetical protein